MQTLFSLIRINRLSRLGELLVCNLFSRSSNVHRCFVTYICRPSKQLLSLLPTKHRFSKPILPTSSPPSLQLLLDPVNVEEPHAPANIHRRQLLRGVHAALVALDRCADRTQLLRVVGSSPLPQPWTRRPRRRLTAAGRKRRGASTR